jgi:molecular chaperone DnaK
MNLGIDLGTTNTAVSRMDDGAPVALAFGDAHQPYDYMPSVLARRRSDRPREEHGRAAKERVGEPRFEVYQNFKMLLGEPPERVAMHWGGGLSQTPEAIAHRFIARLLEQIKTEHGLHPARVVVTVPKVWLVQNLQTKREHLIDGFKRKKGQPFQGHLLVCDCGGSTMDFSLVGVESGAAFDQAVVDRLFPGLQDQETRNRPRFPCA